MSRVFVRRSKPEISEQRVGCALHHGRRNFAKNIVYQLGPLILGFLVESKQLNLGRSQLLVTDLAFSEYDLRGLHGTYCVRPTRIEINVGKIFDISQA